MRCLFSTRPDLHLLVGETLELSLSILVLDVGHPYPGWVGYDSVNFSVG